MILAIASVVLLDRRVGIIRETTEARDARMVWVLAANKIAELELDPTLWTGDGGGSANGDFSEVGPEYAGFAWEYEIVKIEIPMNEPEEPPEEDPPYVYQLTLNLYGPGQEVPYAIQAAFLPFELTQAAKDAESAEGEASENPKPPGSASSPREK